LTALTNEILKQIAGKVLPSSVGELAHLICRRDGMILFTTEKNPDPTLGALACGLWQASHELKKNNFPTENALFKLSFESSSSGVLFNEIPDQNDFFLITLYKQAVNPGFIKAKLRTLVVDISGYSFIDKSSKFLFSDLSDREIDNLFAFAGE